MMNDFGMNEWHRNVLISKWLNDEWLRNLCILKWMNECLWNERMNVDWMTSAKSQFMLLLVCLSM